MAVKDVLKVSRKTFFNPRAWVSYDSLKEQTQTIWGFVKIATTPSAPPQIIETFEQAMQRLGVKPEDLKATQDAYFRYALGFVSLAILDFAYGLYLLFHHHAFLGMVLAIAVCGLLLAQAFKYHFWYFQIKNRKLGCTFEEWKRGAITNG